MFGCVGFLLNGNILIGLWKDSLWSWRAASHRNPC
jgi:hypothetical protein